MAGPPERVDPAMALGGEPVPLPDVPAAGLAVWRVDIDVEREPASASRAVLADVEQARLSSFRRVADRARFAATRAALRHRLGAWLGLPPRAVPLIIDAHGKPRLAGDKIWFSLAHAGRCGFIAMSPTWPVGIDVEAALPDRPLAPLVDIAFSPDEGRRWAAAPEHERAALFLAIWTAKEAFLKAIGTGFLVDPREVTLMGAHGPAVGDPDRLGVDPSLARIRPLPAPAGYVAALAVLAGASPSRQQDATASGMEFS